MKKLLVLALALGAVAACNKDTKKSAPAKQAPAGQDQPAPPTEPPPARMPSLAATVAENVFTIRLM